MFPLAFTAQNSPITCNYNNNQVNQLSFHLRPVTVINFKFHIDFLDQIYSGTARQRRTKYVSPKASARPWNPLWALATP